MSTRSGLRYRGGAAADGGGDGTSDSSDTPAAISERTESQPTEGTAATSPATATATTASDSGNAKTNTKEPFSWRKARRTLFPIHGKDEVHKFLLIGSIKFFIIMALTLTRDTKDTLIVTQCGAEAIAFLKVRVSSNSS